MAGFLRQNWVWIVLPIVLVRALVVALLVFGSGGDDARFVYPVF